MPPHKENTDYKSPMPKCWVYETPDGWLIYAGKTDEDNDLLTLRFARAGEHWFHINGMPGSHVLLCAPEGTSNTEAGKELLEKAAAVAAWHSKARNGGWCTVSTCLAQNVSKPRGAKPGLVELASSRLLKVRPSIDGLVAREMPASAPSKEREC